MKCCVYNTSYIGRHGGYRYECAFSSIELRLGMGGIRVSFIQPIYVGGGVINIGLSVGVSVFHGVSSYAVSVWLSYIESRIGVAVTYRNKK